MKRFRYELWLPAALFSLFFLLPYSYAGTDARMVVEVQADAEGRVPSVQEAIELALPLLWDRIIDSRARGSLSENMKATPFLQRVLPRSDGVQVSFNEARVRQYLDQQQIPYLKEAPRINLVIQMSNQNGFSMPQTAELLRAQAGSFAEARGILLSESGPTLIVAWQWIDNSQVNLVVRGNSTLAEFSETRRIETGDPLPRLQLWMEEILLTARDAHISGPVQTDVMPPLHEQRHGGIEVVITIEQQAALPEQVALEDALRQHEKVESILPAYLSASRRQYRLRLKGDEDAWLLQWFQRRGMQVSPTPQGWLVH
ncbi:MAG: hypothetical protein RQ867_03125 [Mariprofundaceae bacterium]|nr:hypothetical protein [Mariprofundaceae bacterium]